MEPERTGMARQGGEPAGKPPGWRASFVLGLITLALGVVVTLRPSGSLTVISVLLGATMVVSGVFHVLRALDARENERVWRGISGALFILAGLALIRHLHLSLALIGMFIGFTWIIQGISAMLESASRRRTRGETGWAMLFAALSLIGGIVVVSAPIASVAALTIFTGVWFIVMGLMEMLGALVSRRTLGRRGSGQVSVPGPREGTREGSREGDREASAAEDSESHGVRG